MAKLIKDRGSRSAKIVVVGEAPGKREFEEGHAFVGPSGWLLDQWQREAGIDRSSVYYTNVVPYWPGEFAPAAIKVGLNDFKWIPKEIVDAAQHRLRDEIKQRVDDPWLIVPTGNAALRALFGDARRISDYRGSILSVTLGEGTSTRSVKCIPTIHPAATFRRPILTRFCVADWKRIAADSTFRDLGIPARRSIVCSDNEFNTFKEGVLSHGGPVATDVECSVIDGHLQCIAFAYEPSFALVIPLEILGHSRGSDPFLKQCWGWARELCGPLVGPIVPTQSSITSHGRAGTVAKVLQNGLFDQFILKRRGGIDLEDYLYDTLELDHLLYPNDGSDPQAAEDGGEDIKIPMHSLSVLCSLHTRQPFYKGDARDGFKFGWSRLEDLWNYNGLDAMVTIEVFHKLYALAQERGLI